MKTRLIGIIFWIKSINCAPRYNIIYGLHLKPTQTSTSEAGDLHNMILPQLSRHHLAHYILNVIKTLAHQDTSNYTRISSPSYFHYCLLILSDFKKENISVPLLCMLSLRNTSASKMNNNYVFPNNQKSIHYCLLQTPSIIWPNWLEHTCYRQEESSYLKFYSLIDFFECVQHHFYTNDLKNQHKSIFPAQKWSAQLIYRQTHHKIDSRISVS